jgi:hypothetical protein
VFGIQQIVSGYLTDAGENLAIHSEVPEPTKSNDHSDGVIFRQSQSVHPEEQYCQDLSQNEAASCSALIECIEDMIEALAGRFSQFAGDPEHLQRIEIVQGILEALTTLAAITCKNGEFDNELQEEAKKWRNKKPDQKPDQKKEPVTEDQKKTLRERLPSVPEWVWVAVGAIVVGLIIACFATGVCEAGAILAAIGAALGAAADFVAPIILAAMRLAGLLAPASL